MVNKRILWIFPVITQLIFSLFLPFFDGFSLSGIFIFAAFPAFLFAIVCLHYQFHQRNIVQISFWSGMISFFNTIILLSILLAIEQPESDISDLEHSIAVIFYGLMFSLPSIVYAMVVLRLFLAKK